MQKHGMLMMREATDKANPGQTTVIVGDGPLYKIMKELQWLYPDEVGYAKIVCIMGFLHLEMCNQECGGKLMGGSGWEEIFSIAGVFTPGVCSSFLGGKHVKRTWYAYELTLLWLSIMEDRAWDQYIKGEGPHLSQEQWQRRLDECPTIGYWNIVRGLLMLNFQFVCGQRTGDWPLTLSTIFDFLGWYFGFDRNTYTRMTPWFHRDMAMLPEKHPEVHEAFMEGLFVVQRSSTKFSLMGLDQSQEHSVQLVKSDDGSRGVCYDQEEKEMLEISRPEILRVINEFQYAIGEHTDAEVNEHPESSVHVQRYLLKHLSRMVKAVDDGLVSNPYLEEDPKEFVSITTGEVFDPEIYNGIKEIKSKGDAQAEEYVDKVIEKGEIPVTNTIPRNNFYTLRNRPPSSTRQAKKTWM